ncbi:MAG: leukocidin family pore-forming toxin [Enterobacteriaceae bacterium]
MNTTRSIISTMIFLSITPGLALANNYSLGEPTNTGLTIWEHSVPYNNTKSDWLPEDQLIINNASEKLDNSIIYRALDNGATLVIDNTTLDKKKRGEHVLKLIGIGIDAPLLVVAKRNGKLKVSVLKISKSAATLSQSGESDFKKTFTTTATSEKTSQLPINLVNRQLDTLITDMETNNLSVASNTSYRPEKQVDLRIRELNLKCSLYSDYQFLDIVDYCDGKASVDINYNIAMIRSIRADKPGGGSTKNAKYVRVSVSNDYGEGNGIHLRDSLIQDNTWIHTRAYRYTRIGPFAKSYKFWVKPTEGAIPLVVNKLPENENTDYNHTQTNSISIGVNASLGASVGAEGPELSGEVSASASYTNSRELSWNTKEYAIRNTSTGSEFQVAWVRSLDACQELISTEFSCYFTSSHFWGGNMWDESKFNPIAYANFTPNFDVLYEMPVSEKGITNFELGTEITTQAQYGAGLPSAVLSVYGPNGSSYSSMSFTQNIDIDWNSTVFSPEAHVHIRSLNGRNLCLSAEYDEQGRKSIVGRTCNEGINQMWGLDTLERYHSLAGDGLCLTRYDDGSLTTATCDHDLNQKWYWNKDQHKLYSRYTDTGTPYILEWAQDGSIHTVPESSALANRINWRPELTNL